MACLLWAASLPGASASPGWWWGAEADAAWTNKPLEEIRTAAERGDRAALYYLGRASFVGQGCPRDLNQAFAWTLRSAEQGYAQAQFAAGRFYYGGVTLARDYSQGFAWVSRAANQGLPDAMGLLGRANEFGEGTPRNASNALAWFQRAIEAGSRQALTWLGEFYLRGEAGTARRTNYTEALRWFERAATNGVMPAAVSRADMYSKGLGTPPDFARAVHWARHAADAGSPDALELLAGWYANGSVEPRAGRDTPIWLYRRAAAIRTFEARQAGPESWDLVPSFALLSDCRALWNRYRFGVGTPQDYLAAAEWMWVAYQEDRHRLAAGQSSITGDKQGAPNPLESIIKGEMPPDELVKGKLPHTAEERRWQQAVKLVHEALDQAQPAAWHRIGECYRDGSIFSPKDPLLAWSWLARARELGYAPAEEALKRLEATFTTEELAQAKRYWVPPLDRKP